ncbi:hypothetical protein HNP38_003354 [Chryseobacterium defluvii]|uniref:Secreted protein (Por secretion system target) n=1 Tax=Chryseobacterium defluvii TaxID=160396 RepID=A0A840KK17_9FLAO|nr:T9SS type A sorting domain-containing protein [Chryseobacterium defluvii]MBB4808014.1 hypothetical protein [Chryseobacterium defluvii]
MKKLYSLWAVLFFAVLATAQIQVSVQSPGVYKITYGAANDYSAYDPGFGTATFYVHTWVQAGQNSANILYEDAWSNSNVTMNWDSAANAYVGYVNLNSKLFTNSNNTMPASTTVTQLNFVFKDLQNGATKQSGDQFTTLSTTTLGSLSAVDTSKQKDSSFVVEGKLYTSKKGNLEISVFDFNGRLIKTQNTNADGNPIELNIPQKGNYILSVSDKNIRETIKFRY